METISLQPMTAREIDQVSGGMVSLPTFWGAVYLLSTPANTFSNFVWSTWRYYLDNAS